MLLYEKNFEGSKRARLQSIFRFNKGIVNQPSKLNKLQYNLLLNTTNIYDPTDSKISFGKNL